MSTWNVKQEVHKKQSQIFLSYEGIAGNSLEAESSHPFWIWEVKVTPYPFSQYFHHRVWRCTEESLWQNANIHFLYWEKEMKCKGVRSCKNNLSVLFNNAQMKYILLKWVICQRVLQLCSHNTAFSNTNPLQSKQPLTQSYSLNKSNADASYRLRNSM